MLHSLATSAHQLGGAWKQFLPVYNASCPSIIPPLGFKNPYFREDHFSGGRPIPWQPIDLLKEPPRLIGATFCSSTFYLSSLEAVISAIPTPMCQ